MFPNDEHTEAQLEEIGRRHEPRRGLVALVRGKPLRRQQSLVGAVVHHHPHRNLFITAMPKSGSSWLAHMLASFPGYREWIPTCITEMDHTLRPKSLRHPPLGYTMTKLHRKHTPGHLALLNGLQRPDVILLRDLRDAAVSAYFLPPRRLPP